MESRKLSDALFRIARAQQGYFTARQARMAGYSDSRFSYHVKKGHWLREARGIYRLSHFPESERPDLVYWSLWSCNRKGEVQGTFSHQTALAIYDLSDINPSRYYMTVPKTFRKRHSIPKNICLYQGDFLPEEIIQMDGYRIISPLRTLQDIMLDDTFLEEFVMQAINESLERGLVTQRNFLAVVENIQKHRIQRIMKGINL